MNRWLQWGWVSVLLMVSIMPQRGDGQLPPLRPVASTSWNASQAGWAGRMVVLEHMTGSGCEGCQYMDEAINALLRRYPASAFITLGYHLDYDYLLVDPTDISDDRFIRWYGTHLCLPKDNNRKGTSFIPSLIWCNQPGQISGEPDTLESDGLVDGRSVLSINSGPVLDSVSERVYAREATVIDAELQRAPEAFFHVQTTVQDGQVRVMVKVDSLKGQHRKLYLRLLLVEDPVTLHPVVAKTPGSKAFGDLLREQHGVVYGVAHTPTLAMGLPLPGPGTQQYTFDVAAIQRRILRVRQGDTLQTPSISKEMIMNTRARYPDERDWHLDPQYLHVVVFIQDAQSGEVLQAARLPVDGRRLVLPH